MLQHFNDCSDVAYLRLETILKKSLMVKFIYNTRREYMNQKDQ